MLDLILSFLCGVTITLLLLGLAVWTLYNAQPTITDSPVTKGFEPFVRPQLPQHLEDVFAEVNGPDGTQVRLESCNWFNLIADFIFRELRDSTIVKRILMKKINTEFEELMLTKTEGKMIEQLTVRDYFLGTSLPVIKDATIVRIDCSPENDKEPVLIDVAINIDYSGGGEMKIDADLVFNKAAYVAVQIFRVKGRGRLRFSRLPNTHWSFSFYEEPEIKMKVDSHFEGRSFPKLSSFIEAQLRKFVRKKYTLPACKARHKPFFRKTKPQDQLLEMYVKDKKLTVGELQVEVVDCSRLANVDCAAKLYCTVAVASSPYKPQVNLWRTQWPTHEILVPKDSRQKIGILYRMVPQMDRSLLIVVYFVLPNSEAMAAGISVGDVLTRVNNVKVSSVKQVERLIQKSKGSSVLVTVQRPPAHFKSHVCSNGDSPAQPTLTKPQDVIVASGEEDPEYLEDREQTEAHHSADEGNFIQIRSVDVDSISLCGVGGERGLEGWDHSEGRSLRQRRQPCTQPTIQRGTAELVGLFTPELVTSVQSTTEAPADEPLSTMSQNESDAIRLTQMPSQQQPTDNEDPSVAASNVIHMSDQTLPAGQQVTKEVDATKNPCWRQSFTFKVADEHHYLNVCIWNKLTDETGDLLIGHVTIPLMDIALECLCTSSGNHHQRYVLVAAQTIKASASRAALQATSSTTGTSGYVSNTKPREFAGDICLRFKHQPNTSTSSNQDQTSDEALEDPNEDTEQTDPQTFTSSHHPFTASEGCLPSDHGFREVVKPGGSQLCDICQKKIWTLKSRPFQCQYCGLKCHKKCANYCLKEVPCYKRRHSQPLGVSHSRPPGRLLDGDQLVQSAINNSDGDSDKELNYGHRLLQQQQSLRPSVHKRSMSGSDSFEFLEASSSSNSSTYNSEQESQESEAVVHKKTLPDTTDTMGWEMLLQQENSSGSEEMHTPESACSSSGDISQPALPVDDEVHVYRKR